MKNDTLRQFNFKNTVVIFLLLTLVYTTLTTFTLNQRIQKEKETLEQLTVSIAKGYSESLVKARAAYDVINNLVEKRLIDVSYVVGSHSENKSNDALEQIAKQYEVDEIYIYDQHGTIVNSVKGQYQGWVTYPGHPAHLFLTSGKLEHADPVRKDSSSENYLKYGYSRTLDGGFVQIGMHDDHYYSFLNQFEIQALINDLVVIHNIETAFFIDEQNIIVGSNDAQFIGKNSSEVFKENYPLLKESSPIRMVVNNQEVFQASYPVLYNNQSLGTLSIGWPTSYFDQIIKENLFYGILIFLSVMIISNSILYYAFQKDKQNVKLAYYDPLTDLPNSHYLHEYVEKISKDTKKHQRALVLVNCSKLEAMNSTYGLSIGNQIIHYVASKLRHIISSEDMVFRFQQDSFVLIIDQYRSVDDLKAMSHRLIDLLNDSTDPQNTFGSIYPQIGIVELNSNFLDADELLQKASLAISANVLNQRDNIHVYHQELQHWMARQEAIESAIKLTLANQQSSVYLVYQPKLDIKSNTIHGFEALARLSTETLGHVSPIEFIALAEKKFLIFDLGNYILLKACQFAKTLEMKGHGHLSVAINISLLQLLRNEFVDCVQQILSETQVNPKQLQFEITESAFVDNFDTVNAKLKEIQQLGISISLDDFGTGYSSFSRLQKLLISEVKIDKTFVDPINVMHDRDLITPEIIAMAQKLGLVVVAEGVEHEAQKEFLTKNNCDIIQGFVYSTPLSEIESIAFVLNNETTKALASNK